MLDEHLWDIYTCCMNNDLVRSLVLYEQQTIKTERLFYKFVIFTPNPNNFLNQMSWVKQFGSIFHAESEYQFNEYGNYLNCSAIYDTGWGVTFWFISDELSFNYFKQKKARLLIDKDLRFKKEQIKLEGIKYSKWHELPDQQDLIHVIETYYCYILKLFRLIRNESFIPMLNIENQILKPILISLIQWLSYCDEIFMFEELGEINNLLNEAKNFISLIQDKNYQNRINSYLKVGEYLIKSYADIMQYQIENTKINHLKQCITVQAIKDFTFPSHNDSKLLYLGEPSLKNLC